MFFRVISSLQRQMVMDDFTPEFARKLQDFYKKLYFPTEVKSLRNRCVFVQMIITVCWSLFECYYNFVCVCLCILQPVCPSLGRCPAGVCAERTECDGRPKRQRKEGRPDWTNLYSVTENRSATATAQVQHAHRHTLTSHFYKLLIKLNPAVLSLSAGTESCVATCESSNLMTPNCECSNNQEHLTHCVTDYIISLSCFP